jgi:hypothetical protein
VNNPLRIRLAGGSIAYVHAEPSELRRLIARARQRRRHVVTVDGRSLPLDRLEQALAEETAR